MPSAITAIAIGFAISLSPFLFECVYDSCPHTIQLYRQANSEVTFLLTKGLEIQSVGGTWLKSSFVLCCLEGDARKCCGTIGVELDSRGLVSSLIRPALMRSQHLPGAFGLLPRLSWIARRRNPDAVRLPSPACPVPCLPPFQMPRLFHRRGPHK